MNPFKHVGTYMDTFQRKYNDITIFENKYMNNWKSMVVHVFQKSLK